jgi:hypothetical protein
MLKKLVILVTVLVLASVGFAKTQGTPGLKAAWDWENGGADISGQGDFAMNAVIQAGTPLQADPLGQKGTVLNLANGWAKATASPDGELDFDADMTLRFMVYCGANDQSWKKIVAIGDFDDGRVRVFNQQSGIIWDSNLSQPDEGWNPQQQWWLGWSPNTWHDVVITHASPGTTGANQKVYSDGVLVDSQSTLGGDLWDFTGIVQFGAGDGAIWMLDQVALWNGVATAQQVADLYSGAKTIYNVGIPEPATMTMLGLGVLALIRRK